MEEFNRFIDSNLHQILGLMIDNANKLLDEAHNAGIVTDASLEQIRTRFENPGPDHRNWFKARFWQV